MKRYLLHFAFFAMILCTLTACGGGDGDSSGGGGDDDSVDGSPAPPDSP